MKSPLALAIFAFALAGLFSVGAADPPSDDKPAAGQAEPSLWMKKKLEYSEHILAGLASEDFDKIAQAARSMNALGQIEKWVRAGQPHYRTQLATFHEANERLIACSQDNDLDGATLAYLQLTLSCINCHKIIRDKK